MNAIKRLAVLCVMITAASTIEATGCRTRYLNYLDVCEHYTSGFQEQGCYMDAYVDYVICVGRAAIG